MSYDRQVRRHLRRNRLLCTANPTMVTLLVALAASPSCVQPATMVVEPLRVINWFPDHGAICTSVGVTLKATFSHDVDPETLTADSLHLQDSNGRVAASIDYDRATFTAHLLPAAALAYDRLHTIVATTEIRAVERGNLPVELTASFTTVSRSGCTPGVECQLPSDCPAPQICANIGVCIDECVTDRDCYYGSCNAGTCFDDADPDGEPMPGDAMSGDTVSGDAAGAGD